MKEETLKKIESQVEAMMYFLAKLVGSPGLGVRVRQCARMAIVLTLLSFGGSLVSSPLDTWTLRSPHPVGATLQSVTFGDGRFIAVGDNGSVATSNDGFNWESIESGTHETLLAVGYGGGRYVAVDDSGGIISSTDGIDWTYTNVGQELSLLTTCYGGGRHIVAGRQGVALTSIDSVTWETAVSNTTESIVSVIYVENGFIAMTFSGAVLQSTDGAEWNEIAIIGDNRDAQGESITYGNGVYVAALNPNPFQVNIFTSSDAINWTPRDIDSGFRFNKVDFLNGRFVASGNTDLVSRKAGIATSEDGIVWQTIPTQFSDPIHSIAFGQGAYVACGGGFILRKPLLASSPDIQTWTNQIRGFDREFTSVSYLNHQFLAPGFSRETGKSTLILTSSDGIDWTPWDSSTEKAIEDITYGKGKYVAVGLDGVIVSSEDGKNWTPRESGVTVHLGNVAYGNRMFVALGNPNFETGEETILTSNDGIIWTERGQFLDVYPEDLHFVNGLFVYFGNFFNSENQRFGLIQTSQDGIDWTEQVSVEGEWPSYASYGNGILVAPTDSGTVYTSEDGVNWTTNPSVLEPADAANGVHYLGAFGAGRHLIMGDRGKLLTSVDGIEWSSQPNPIPHSTVRSITYGGGNFIAVGGFSILQSGSYLPRFSGISFDPTGNRHLKIEGALGTTVQVEASTDLENWLSIGQLVLEDAPGIFIDMEDTFSSHRFYRPILQ